MEVQNIDDIHKIFFFFDNWYNQSVINIFSVVLRGKIELSHDLSYANLCQIM